MKNEHHIIGDKCWITLTQEKTCCIDACDMDKISNYKWYAKDNGQGQFYANAHNPLDLKKILMHRMLMGFPKGMMIDHICPLMQAMATWY